MIIVKYATLFLKKIDLFPSTQFIKYKKEPDHTTATGGFISVAVIIVFAILFTSLAV